MPCDFHEPHQSLESLVKWVWDHEFVNMAPVRGVSGFLLAIPIAPVVSAVPPLASGPILCLLGALMCSSVRGIDWEDYQDELRALRTP